MISSWFAGLVHAIAAFLLSIQAPATTPEPVVATTTPPAQVFHLASSSPLADLITVTTVLTPGGVITDYATSSWHAYYIIRSEMKAPCDSCFVQATLGKKSIEPDPKTFVSLDNAGNYFKDSTYVYKSTWQDFYIVKGADPSTFTLRPDLEQKAPGKDPQAETFASDKAHVFYASNIIPSADPLTFKRFPGSRYAYDSTNVFYLSTSGAMLIKNADLHTFATVSTSSAEVTFDAHDTKHKYLQGVVVR